MTKRNEDLEISETNCKWSQVTAKAANIIFPRFCHCLFFSFRQDRCEIKKRVKEHLKVIFSCSFLGRESS